MIHDFKLIREVLGLEVKLLPFLKTDEGYADGLVSAKELEKFLESAVRVYSDIDGELPEYWSNKNEDGDTHTALLVGVKEIEKKKCEHPKEYRVTFPSRSGEGECGLCGVKLKAVWQEA